MEMVFKNKFSEQPSVSIILLDWSVRESYHVLHYLNNQTVPREIYEIIWIEYYDRRPKEIEAKLKECSDSGRAFVIDKWIVMGMAKKIYYHKHLMYNAGIVAGNGRIITFMDSDAMAKPTFVESIIKSFEQNSNIVLHMDQVRNINKKFYPFSYPAVDEIVAEGGVNMLNGKPVGLIDKSDPMHLVNYGSCMSSLRDDLIAIGGADEHIDYLGHICGPYEMTFRLVNAGKKEIWHQTEWLYHTWHPGQAGDKNFAGPHDGRHMSTTALESRWTGRIMPLVENPAIKMFRLRQTDSLSGGLSMSQVINEEEIKNWMIDKKEFVVRKYRLGSKNITMGERGQKRYGRRLSFMTGLYLRNILFRMRLKQKYILLNATLKSDIKYAIGLVKNRSATVMTGMPADVYSAEVSGDTHSGLHKLRKVIASNRFLKPLLAWYRTFFKIRDGITYRLRFINSVATAGYNKYIADECWRNLYRLSKDNKEIAVFGVGRIARILHILTDDVPIKICGIYDDVRRKRFSGYDVQAVGSLKGYDGKVIIASVFGVDERSETLRRIGIKDENIIRLL